MADPVQAELWLHTAQHFRQQRDQLSVTCLVMIQWERFPWDTCLSPILTFGFFLPLQRFMLKYPSKHNYA